MIYKLHEETLALVKEERKLTGLVIENLQKISNQRLYLEMGYSSLFEYCTKALGYSEHCAYRRIQAVKIARVLPEVKEKLNAGTLNLTTLSMAQSLITGATLTVDEKREVLAQIENCSKREAERVVAAIADKKGIIPIEKRGEKLRHISAQEARLQVCLKQETIEKLDRLKSLRAHKNPSMSYADLIEDMCEFMLKKLDPVRKPEKPEHKTESKNPRYISAKLKVHIWHRDDGRCTFTDKQTQRRCESGHLLQIDHIQPLALGGETRAENLRLLCHAHHKNREYEFGGIG